MIKERLRAWYKTYNRLDNPSGDVSNNPPADISNNAPSKKSKKKQNKKAAKEKPKKWPANMIFFRDGISESQFKDCIDDEIATIKQAYSELCGQELTLTFIVCGKRHNTRFYATEEKQTYREELTVEGDQIDNAINGNVQPGLLVINVVTNPTPFNYFLQSHRAIKGTARSAHYHVLEDGMQLGEKRLPQLTMMLCYAFSHATTGVSYAAPAYIADSLCERGRAYLREWYLDTEMEPRFQIPTPRDANGKRKRVTEPELMQAKKDFAEKLSKNEEIWGKYYGKPLEDGVIWHNPWNPSLLDRDGMFWM